MFLAGKSDQKYRWNDAHYYQCGHNISNTSSAMCVHTEVVRLFTHDTKERIIVVARIAPFLSRSSALWRSFSSGFDLLTCKTQNITRVGHSRPLEVIAIPGKATPCKRADCQPSVTQEYTAFLKWERLDKHGWWVTLVHRRRWCNEWCQISHVKNITQLRVGPRTRDWDWGWDTLFRRRKPPPGGKVILTTRSETDKRDPKSATPLLLLYYTMHHNIIAKYIWYD